MSKRDFALTTLAFIADFLSDIGGETLIAKTVIVMIVLLIGVLIIDQIPALKKH